MGKIVLGRQIVAARGLVGMSQAELAKQAQISAEALNKIERGVTKNPHNLTLEAVQRVLEDAGVEFLNSGQPGVRLKLAKAGWGADGH